MTPINRNYNLYLEDGVSDITILIEYIKKCFFGSKAFNQFVIKTSQVFETCEVYKSTSFKILIFGVLC